MTQYNMPEDVLDYIKGLEDRVSKLEKLTRAGATSIDNGALTIKKNGQVIAAFGDLAQAGYPNYRRPDGTSQMGVLLFRDNGEIAFSMWDDSPLAAPGYQQYWAWRDRSGRIVLSDDTDSGWGLATPYLPSGVWLNNDTSHWPLTTSATFVTAWDTYYRVQHNKLYVNFMLYCDAATTGEARLTIDGTQYGPTISTTGAGFAFFDQILVLPQSLHMVGYPNFKIEYRRVSGTGNVKVSPRIMYGRQT
jgi:hypothetical protein